MGIMNGRINKYDNIKGLAIFLIVIWHLNSINAFAGTVFFRFIFLIALPSFFFVSGYFSKIGPDEPLKAFKRLFIPYIIFSIVTRIALIVITGEGNFDKLFLTSNYLWFLIALFFMKMALPIVDKFKYPIMTAFIVALLFGFITFNHSILGISRGICYFPIFLLGFYYNDYKNKFEEKFKGFYDFIKRNSKPLLILSIVYLLLVTVFISNTKSYVFSMEYNGNLAISLIKRAIIIIAYMITVLILNKYMTNKKCVLTTIGVNSMAVYVLHYYCAVALRKPFNVFLNHELIFVPVLLIFACILTFVLSRNIVTKYFNNFTDFFYNLIVKKT